MLGFRTLVFSGILASISAMYYSHRIESKAMETRVSQVNSLLEANQGIQNLALEVEKFRAKSPDFRKMEAPEVSSEISKIDGRFKKILASLNKGAFEESERKQISAIEKQLDDLVALCQKLLPTIYSKDPFQTTETRETHAEARKQIERVINSLHDRGKAGAERASDAAAMAIRIFLASAIAILLLLLGVFFADHLTYERPLKKLHELALKIENGKPAVGKVGEKTPLQAMYGKIADVLGSLSSAAERQFKERHKFILDLFSDFAVPLNLLRAGKGLIAGGPAAELTASQIQASDSVKRGIATLAGSLEDLSDLAEFGKLETRLEDQVVDLSEVVVSVSRILTGSDPNKQISTALPPMPIWARVDARRLERVLTHVILKVAGTLEGQERIHVALAEAGQQGGQGVEILIQGVGRMRERSSVGSGPEVDITRHWISEQGLFLGLMSKIIRAQGGTITASGVTGTSVQVRIRLPQDRVMAHGLINAPRGLETDIRGHLSQDQARERSSS